MGSDRSWLGIGVTLERPSVGIEGVGAVKFLDLAKMAEVVVGEFVKHLRESDGAHFVVLAGARAGAGGNGMQVREKGAAESGEFFEVTRSSGFSVEHSVQSAGRTLARWAKAQA